MWSLILLAGLALLTSQARALYFYIDGPTQKCFFEELPKDTMVVGMALKSENRFWMRYTNRSRLIQSHTME